MLIFYNAMEITQKLQAERLKQNARTYVNQFCGTCIAGSTLLVQHPLALCVMLSAFCFSCQQRSAVNQTLSDYVSLIENDSLNRIDVMVDGKYFTSYLYADTLLRKPVLFPLLTANEERVTRGFPLAPNPGERIDHPHHYGLWFNHGDVNGVDFWNSSAARKNDDPRYGRIDHVKFLNIVSGGEGILEVEKEWRNHSEALLLIERTQYVFSGDTNKRIITHTSTLLAPESDVLFEDSKEGMFAMRVRRELEIPSNDSTVLLNDKLVASDKPAVDGQNISGHYRNSNGLEGYPDVWGKRAKWMQLSGLVNGDSISICIFDHPTNLNHPPHWMARDYGLYGVNSLGSNLYTEGKEQFNFSLKKGDSVTFKHQVVIVDRMNPSPGKIEAWYGEFVKKD
jgi:hypothetical protein